MSNSNEEWKRLNPPAGYVRAYGVDCLRGSLFNETTKQMQPPSSTTVDPHPQAPDDIALYKESTLVGLMKASYYDGYTERENELRESNLRDIEAELSATKQRLEPLRREVAMLRDTLAELKSTAWLVPVQQLMYRGNTIVRKSNDALSDTQETAEAYEREVKAEALEEAASKFMYGVAHELRILAAELRAKGISE